jgi:hypothetical protein
MDSLFAHLDGLELTREERKELEDIAHAHVHQTILDAILSELSEADKKKFLELLALGEDEKVWEHLNANVERIEQKIEDAAKKVKEELASDAKKIKKS